MPTCKRVVPRGKGKAKAKAKGKAKARTTRAQIPQKEEVQPAELGTAGPAEAAAGVAAVGQRTEVDMFVEHENVVCKCCGEEISKIDAQTTGRVTQSNQIKCNKCNSTISRLQRLKLKVGALDEIDEADRVAFFQHAKDLYGTALWEHHKLLLKKVTTDYDTAESSGEYLPINVHVKHGWTEEQVMAYDDYKDDPRLGRVWRVPVLRKSTGQTVAQSHEQEMSAETDSKRLKTNGGQPKGRAQMPQDPSQWTEAHALTWATKFAKELKESVAKLEEEMKIPDGGEDTLAPKSRTAAETALARARDILLEVEEVAKEEKSLTDVRKNAPVEEYVKSVVDNRKGLVTHAAFIKRVKAIAAKQFPTALSEM